MRHFELHTRIEKKNTYGEVYYEDSFHRVIVDKMGATPKDAFEQWVNQGGAASDSVKRILAQNMSIRTISASELHIEGLLEEAKRHSRSYAVAAWELI